ncbi:hypothetical protein TYRP_015437, partial [Tyrophagus putrescentiae]
LSRARFAHSYLNYALTYALTYFFSKSKIWVKLNQLSNDSPWSHLAHQKRPPTRTSLAPLARPSSAGVFGEPSDSRPRRFYLCTANIHSCLGRRLTLTALRAQRARPSAADVAHCPSHVRPRRPGLCSAAPATTVLPPAAQDESGGSDSSENGSESAQLYPELLR